MLLRQLHRPLLRSVAAAWRPATIPTLFYHGDSRCCSSNSNNGQQQEASSPSPPPSPTKQKPSLFEQLFPDEVKKSQPRPRGDGSDTDVPRNTWVSQLFEEPPRLVVPKEPQDEKSSIEKNSDVSPDFRAKSMLVLSAASKHLLESDFLRLGARGKHVEGWVGGGILKVIQARDPDTLEPKGHYFILFDTHEAAIAYKDKLEHLWQLGKTYIPGAHHARSHMRQQPLPTGLRHTDQGEDVAKLISSFTLVPPSQRYHIQLSRMGPAKIAELYLEGGFVDQLAAVAGSRFLVLIHLDGGRLTLDTLRRAIEDDGVRRNLAWRITDLDNGILPFGKSILKAKDQSQVDITSGPFVDEGYPQGSKDNDSGYPGEASGSDYGKDMVTTIYKAEENTERHRQYPRFIIPFLDKAEAHRFVRNWHRRELRLRMSSGSFEQSSWDETRIINATVLW
ncbi:hypothetical protein HD806DRAFT_271468 [Xylariaceae sp. AK1471]|nr:hypothetical protein HD806DRAFT_271468 [Xylariaceae sp. AK1471]